MSLEQIQRSIGDREEFDPQDNPGLRAAQIDALGEADLQQLARDRQTVEPSLQRVRRLIAHVKALFVRRDKAVELLAACIIARVPIVLLGDWGSGKSDISRSLCEALGLRGKHEDIEQYHEALVQVLQGKKGPDIAQKQPRPLFEYMLTRYTTPEEIVGQQHIKAMLDLTLHYRDPIGMLPTAYLVYLDEIFKANSAILNCLLSIINERLYYNAGRTFRVNLLTVVGASNEAPDSEELGALYDRFPIRVICDAVPDEAIADLVRVSSRRGYEKGVAPANGSAPVAERIACLADFRLLGRVIHPLFEGPALCEENAPRNPHNAAFAREFNSAFKSLRRFGISDRTPALLIRLAKAQALLQGRETLQAADLDVFKFCGPNRETARLLEDVVNEIIANAGRNWPAGPAAGAAQH